MTPQEVDSLPLIPLCILLGAVTPDHKIKRLPLKEYLRFTRDRANKAKLKAIHGR